MRSRFNLSFKCPVQLNKVGLSCKSCGSNVHDFSAKSLDEINHVIRQSDNLVCGIFNVDQIAKPTKKIALVSSIVLSQSIINLVHSQTSLDKDTIIEDLPQKNKSEESETKDWVGIIVEQMPEFKGGTKQMQKYFATNLKLPKTKEVGRVIVTFWINEEGKITKPEIVKGFNKQIDSLIFQFFNTRTEKLFTPGVQNGRKVSVRYTVPIKVGQ